RIDARCKLQLSTEAEAFMSLYLPVAFLSMQAIVLAFFGPSVTGPAAYILMVIAPLFTAAATLWRGRSHSSSVRHGWYALSLALTIWAVGAFGNLWQEMVLHRQNEMYRASMLAFNLAVVPTTYLLASDWRLHGRQLLRLVDALVALALGCAYFEYTWSMINDHYFAGTPAFGPQYATLVTLAFAVLCSFALRPPSAAPVRSVNSTLVRIVRSGSPILLAVALLAASLLLIRVQYLWGCVGILIAVLGIGVRTTLIQVHQIEHREALRQKASALQTIAWTDALTGVPNRH